VRIFHITEPDTWSHATATGLYTGSTRGASLDEVGFVHCSFAEQVDRVAGYVYGDEAATLLLLEIETDGVPAEVRVENLEGGEELFPHVYGPIPVQAVVAVRRMVRSSRGWSVGGELTS
jgi:uncharacterized protein (DUF952 family)